MVFGAGEGPEVLIGHGAEVLAEQIGLALSASGLRAVRVASGDKVPALATKRRPRAVVLDVALEGVMAFQVIDWVRKQPGLEGVKVVLVASVFNRTAYKRRPSSLYGADDYVEQHHIRDHLPERLCALLGLPAPRAGDVQRRIGGTLEGGPEVDLRERARAVARQIVADIALYHQADIARASRGEPAPGLTGALDEGRRMLADVVDPRTYAGDDPILDALRALISELSRLSP